MHKHTHSCQPPESCGVRARETPHQLSTNRLANHSTVCIITEIGRKTMDRGRLESSQTEIEGLSYRLQNKPTWPSKPLLLSKAALGQQTGLGGPGKQGHINQTPRAVQGYGTKPNRANMPRQGVLTPLTTAPAGHVNRPPQPPIGLIN